MIIKILIKISSITPDIIEEIFKCVNILKLMSIDVY